MKDTSLVLLACMASAALFAACGDGAEYEGTWADALGGPLSQGDVVATPTNCKPLPSVCDDNDVCTDDFCDPVTGQCKYTEKDKSACDDGNACTTGDVCAGRVCGGAIITCDDQNPCTIDSCIAQTGCKFTDSTAKAPATYGLGDASYTVCADALSWDQAADACQKLGKTLVQLDSSDEATFVAQQVGQLSFLADYWVALSDSKAEGTFEWRAGNPAALFLPAPKRAPGTRRRPHAARWAWWSRRSPTRRSTPRSRTRPNACARTARFGLA